MTTGQKSTAKSILKDWLTPSLLLGLIASLLVSYGGMKEYIKTVTFSDAEIKALSEDFIKRNMGISGRENLEAQQQLTKKYTQLTVAIDTLSVIYQKSFESMDAYLKTNQAILEMVSNVDSVSMERLTILKELVKENKIQSNATQLNLDKADDILKLLNNFNPHTNINGD